MKKLISVILVSLILGSGLISCAQTDLEQTTNEDVETNETNETNEINQFEETNVETEPSYLDTLEKKNFDGASYLMAAAVQGDLPAFAVEYTGEVVNDAMFERDLKVNNMYNVKIEYMETEDSPNTAKSVANSVLAGVYYSDLYRDPLSNGAEYMSSAFRSGALYNLIEVPYLSLDQSWWSKLLYENLQYNGKMFFTAGDLATASFNAPACAFMNVTVANNNNIDVNEIFQLVSDGAWTVDEMMKLTDGLRRDLNGDGLIVPEDDAYGVVTWPIELNSTVICVGAGIQFCEVDEAGNLAVNLNTEEVINKIQKISQCFNEIKSNESPSLDMLREDRTLFLMHFVESASLLRDMESDFAILPMPKYDEKQETYISYTNPHTHSYLAIPLIQPDIERTGFITEVLEYLSVEMVRPAIYDVTLKGKIARDPNTRKMLDIVFDTTYIDFNTLNNFGGSTVVVSRTLFSGKDFASSFQKIEKLVNNDLEMYSEFFN